MNLPKHELAEKILYAVPPHYAKDIQPFLVKRFDCGPSFYFIYHYGESRYVFAERQIEQILLCKASELYAYGDNFFLSRMHPDDLPQHRLAMQHYQAFFQQLPRHERPHYTVSFDYRIRNNQGQYVRLLQQLVHMEYDVAGSPLYSLEKCTNISHWLKGPEMTLSIVGPNFRKNMVFRPASKLKPRGKSFFTSSEIKVLQLLSQGKTSKETADILNLSANTINTHRRNMRRKAGVKSTTSLIRMARQRQLLQDDF